MAYKILFQGDSITDASRNRGFDGTRDPALGLSMGCGYALLVAARTLADHPAAGFQFLNMGISGNRVTDLAARAKEHIWNLSPDLLSILIGVNDTWHEFMRGAGVDLPRYERVYRHLLEDTRQHLPAVKFVLCEPFVLPCGVVAEGWREEVDQRREVVRRLAAEFSAVFVPFQGAFDQALSTAPAEFWAEDGVHPTPAGHQLMADVWLKSVGTLPV